MANKDSALIPLNLVQEYTKNYPAVWELAEKFRQWPEANETWDMSRCYIPIAAGVSIYDFLKMPASAVYMVPALAAWRQSKEVYTFDPDLAEALYAQASDTKIPCDVLRQLPVYCVFIDSGKYKFFAHLENDVSDGRWELRFVRVNDDGSTGASYLHLGDFTLDESITAGLDESQYQIEHLHESKEVLALFKNALAQPDGKCDYSGVTDRTALSEMLQLVLYICADNADMVQSPDNQKTYRAPSGGKIQDKYREVRKWNTGYYVGNALRKEKSANSGTEQPYQGGSKRPHIRRGHWHHFWKGKNGSKELVLHWVLPIFVNGDDSNGELPARVTPVK